MARIKKIACRGNSPRRARDRDGWRGLISARLEAEDAEVPRGRWSREEPAGRLGREAFFGEGLFATAFLAFGLLAVRSLASFDDAILADRIRMGGSPVPG